MGGREAEKVSFRLHSEQNRRIRLGKRAGAGAKWQGQGQGQGQGQVIQKSWLGSLHERTQCLDCMTVFVSWEEKKRKKEHNPIHVRSHGIWCMVRGTGLTKPIFHIDFSLASLLPTKVIMCPSPIQCIDVKPKGVIMGR
jgi:hypothetical protein